ncbi:MAG TPA: hypothetical protein VKX17_23355 [Planctomycetota bacterium]|nr:hypothetical protein [Planctomycetota bacterium]
MDQTPTATPPPDQNPDPNLAPPPDDASTPYLDNPPEQLASGPVPPLPPGRVEANTALLKVSMAAGQAEIDSQFPLDEDDDNTPPPFGDDLENTEAASARIAQEYRRQVRIKRLADEIKQAEREKKEVERQRRAELDLKTPSTVKRKEETAKLQIDPVAADYQEAEEQARKRIAAMSAFKAGTTFTKKRRTGRWIAIAAVLMLIAMGIGGWKVIDSWAVQARIDQARQVALRVKAKQDTDARTAEDAKAREAELEKQKLADAETAKKADEERLRIKEQMRAQQEAELKRLQEEESVRRAAEEKRVREETERMEAKARIEQEALRKKVEEAQRIAREKLKAEQEAEAAKAAAEKNKAATDVKPAVVLPDAKPDAVKPEVSKIDPPKTVPPTNDVPKPEAPKAVVTLNGPVKTIPSDPPVPVPDKLELPSGGVRLYVKASDPYGGPLTFQWKQLRGSQVDIADPTAAKFKDGKWHSQTYFVAREAGAYEFEVIVKNDEGVETRKKFPIEVLPPTTLK